MSLLSANTLFHFTNLENLLSILKNGFHPRYHEEDMSLFRKFNQNIAIPMVCFCDIPLSLTKKHIKRYGGYGIGLTKKWAKENKIGPVMYCVQKSQASENLKKGLDHLDRFTSKKTSLPQELEIQLAVGFDELKKFTYFMKPVKYYDEKEWRFVPRKSEEFVIPDMHKGKKLKSYIETLNKTSPSPEFLRFESQDIKYIIVNNSHEIDEVVTFMKKLHKFDARNLNFLMTKMLTLKDILEDF